MALTPVQERLNFKIKYETKTGLEPRAKGLNTPLHISISPL